MRIPRSRRALSPVVASIILIAVTVAVSITVAAWMAGLVFSNQGVEQLTLRKLWWTGPNTGFILAVDNTGTRDATITQIQVNYGTSGVNVTQPTLPVQLKASLPTNVTVAFTYSNGTAYDITVATSSGKLYTDHFTGGYDRV
jgi:flagellin-like protein